MWTSVVARSPLRAQAGLPIAQSMVEGKLRNSRTFLMRNARSDVQQVLAQLKSLAERVAGSDSIESLLGMEGAGARLYFSKFTSMIRDESLGVFDFNGRNRRPPKDPINCLLSIHVLAPHQGSDSSGDRYWT